MKHPVYRIAEYNGKGNFVRIIPKEEERDYRVTSDFRVLSFITGIETPLHKIEHGIRQVNEDGTEMSIYENDVIKFIDEDIDDDNDLAYGEETIYLDEESLLATTDGSDNYRFSNYDLVRFKVVGREEI